MKLLLSGKEMDIVSIEHRKAGDGIFGEVTAYAQRIVEAQLKKIFNLDMKTTSELIVKLEARLDELYQKELAK